MFAQVARYKIELGWLLLLAVLVLLTPRPASAQHEMAMLYLEGATCDGPPVDCYIEVIDAR